MRKWAFISGFGFDRSAGGAGYEPQSPDGQDIRTIDPQKLKKAHIFPVSASIVRPGVPVMSLRVLAATIRLITGTPGLSWDSTSGSGSQA
jgi:hypothetical protein